MGETVGNIKEWNKKSEAKFGSIKNIYDGDKV